MRRVSGLSLSRGGAQILSGVDLGVDSGETVAVIGPSGCGKTSLLRAIAGLDVPSAGTITWAGADLVRVAPHARGIGFVFQDYALFPHLTVRQNIAFSLAPGWLNPRPRHRDDTVEYWLDAFRLRALADQFPSELSGGQRQRTALARALVSRPRALLLDEPFSALDPALRVAMRDELDELQQRLQVPMVLITHDPEDAAVFGDHVLNLQDGRLEAIESAVPDELAGA